MLTITNYKITPKQLAEIESHLELASWILNSEDIPNWEDLQTACRQVCDAREDLKMIREKTETSRAAETAKAKEYARRFLPLDEDSPEPIF